MNPSGLSRNETYSRTFPQPALTMWEQAEFEKHWRNEFPDSEAPVMNLRSVEDIEAELEKCKANLKGLQLAISEEKFKVIYLQTTISQKKTCDFERRCNNSKKESPCDLESKGGDEPFVRDILRGTKTGKPIPVPPRKKPDIPREHSAARDMSRCVAEQRINEQDSDHEFEDVELNENFLRKNILNPKGKVRESPLLNRRVCLSRELDSDDGLALRGSHGSGRSTPDGYLSSDHDDDSSAGRADLTTPNSYRTSFLSPLKKSSSEGMSATTVYHLGYQIGNYAYVVTCRSIETFWECVSQDLPKNVLKINLI